MNRELKFRVWNGMEMVYDVTVGKFGAFYVNPGHKGNGLDPNDSASLTPFTTKYSAETPVMQFTGLKDRRGVDIYEGDILFDPKYSMVSGSDYMPENRIVVWDKKDASFKLGYADQTKKNGGDYPSGKILCKANCDTEFAVIGDIYQNPELFIPRAVGV